MMTTRDFNVVDFVKKFKVADTGIIKDLYYPSIRVCQRRMKDIVNKGHLNAARERCNSSYLYFAKQLPQQLKHYYYIAKFYAELSKICEIKKFNIEVTYGNLRADGAFVYVHNGLQKVGLLEVELSNKGFDWGKYNRFISNDNYKSFMTVKPLIFILSDAVNPKKCNFDYKIINLDFNNLVL